MGSFDIKLLGSAHTKSLMNTIFSHKAPYIAELKRIESLIQSNQLQLAATKLNEMVKSAPQDPRLFLLGSQLSQASGNADGALKAARKACELAPLWAVATIHLASVFASRGELQEAFAFAKQAVLQAETQSTVDLGLISQAAAIARDCGQLDSALQWLYRAQRSAPSDTATSYKIGLVMGEMGDFEGALAAFDVLAEQMPGNAAVLSARRQAALGAEQFDAAIRDSEALLALDPTNLEHQYFLAVAKGETPHTTPASIIALQFDAIALRYDQSQVVEAQYQLPGVVGKMIAQWYPDLTFDLLDLGCGTGLLGACLGPVNGVIVGVDLSNGMIEQASQGRGYASFHRVNLIDAIQATPQEHYHVISALDAFPFVGDLATVIPHAHRVLMAGGHFVFSCESAADQLADYALQSSHRYTHRVDYVKRLMLEAQFVNIEVQETVLRIISGRAVTGFLVSAQKQSGPAASVIGEPEKSVPRATKSAKRARPAQ